MDWISLAQNLGIPVTCLAALAFAVWKSLVWLGMNVVKPVADRHIKFLDAVETAINGMVRSITALGGRMDNLENKLETIHQDVRSGYMRETTRLKDSVEAASKLPVRE